MNQKQTLTRVGAFLLCICLCLSFLCVFVSASRAEENDTRSPLPVSYGKSYTVNLSGCSPTKGWTDTGKQLTDHAFGSGRLTAENNHNWTGYTSNGGNFTVQILLDLGMVYDNLRHFTGSFVQDTANGAYFPRSVTYEVSKDGKSFTSLGQGECDCDVSLDPYCGLFNLTLQNDVQARYVRVNIAGGAGQSVFLCEIMVEGRAQLTRIGEYAKEGTQYTDKQGVVYTLRNGKAVVTGYRDTTLTSGSGTVQPSDANFNREGDYVLGTGSKNPVTVHAEFIPRSNMNFSRLSNDIRNIVIHNTGTVEESTNAARYHQRLMSGASDSSWHYTVDENNIYHSVPDEYAAWHAGSDENYASIGIEMCVNGAPTAGGTNFIFKGAAYERWVEEHFRKTIENTAVLVAELLIKYDLPESAVIQHNDCSGKNCPQWLRYCSSDGKYRREGDLWILLTERIHEYYTALSANARAFTPASDVVLPEYLLFSGGISAPVSEIASGAFAGRGPVLRSIALPDTLTKVALGAFTDTPSLEAVTVSPSHPTLYLKGTDLYDKNGTLLFSPQKEEEVIPPSPREDSGLWVEEHDGEYWLFGLPTPCSEKELKALYGAKELHLYADAVGTGAFLRADGAAMRIVLQGDSSGDGVITSADYMLTKRTVLGSYHPAPIFARAMMIYNGKTIGPIDYLLIKRCVLGTFKLPEPAKRK